MTKRPGQPGLSDKRGLPEAAPPKGQVSSAADVSAFLQKAASVPVAADAPLPQSAQAAGQERGRLIFALDATMSRQATWDRAMHIQSEMFQVAGCMTGLAIKLVYFRGFGECRASRWVERSDELAGVMSRIFCQGGRTQIGKVLKCALEEARREKVSALVYVGDCMEEDVDLLCARAGELGLLRVPIFLFQEGSDPVADGAFREMARLSGGAHCPFSSGSADRLAQLLKAVAAYASGGRRALLALKERGDPGARLLLEKLPG